MVKIRHAKILEPGNLLPEHFWRKIREFFRNQSIKEINLKFCWGFVKNRFKWMPVSLHIYLKHHYMYSYTHLFSKFVQINCLDISLSKSQFPGKNNFFACLFSSSWDWDLLELICILFITRISGPTGPWNSSPCGGLPDGLIKFHFEYYVIKLGGGKTCNDYVDTEGSRIWGKILV